MNRSGFVRQYNGMDNFGSYFVLSLLVGVLTHALVRRIFCLAGITTIVYFFIAIGMTVTICPILFLLWIATMTDLHINLGFLPIGGAFLASYASPGAVLAGLPFLVMRLMRETQSPEVP